MNTYPTVEDLIGNTPVVRLQRMNPTSSTILVKLEGNNPAGSVKDRPALAMLKGAELRGELKPGDRIIEATSGNTGIALAMACAVRGYKMTLVMPENASAERVMVMKAYGAEVILTPAGQSMEGAIDKARTLEAAGYGRILDQFGNPDNPASHYSSTGPEIWTQTKGAVTHFIASMGTTGTLTGTGRFLHEKNKAVQVVGVQPLEGEEIPGIRKWPEAYLPRIYDQTVPDRVVSVSKAEAWEMTRRLAAEEGLLCGISTGGNVAAALAVARDLEDRGTPGVLVTIQCDRGDKYLSTGVFPS